MPRKGDEEDPSDPAPYLKQLAEANANLKNEPDNEEWLELKHDLEELIPILEADWAEKQASRAPVKKPTTPSSALSEETKWSRENHPAFQPGYKPIGQPEPAPPPPPKPAVVLQVNDTVKAKWVHGDKQYYNARIISITGSSADPVYTVKFKGYDDTDTIRAKDILPVSNDTRKRKAEDLPSDVIPPLPPKSTGVISGAASIDPVLATKLKEHESAKEKHLRQNKAPRQLKGSKELAKKQNSWKDFQAKGTKAAKATKQTSMFASGESLNYRVGYVGSGKAMSKDPARTRHVYQQVDDADDDE